MSKPIETVVRVASTPSQAQIFVAMLQAEGIPARIEGDSLTDEFAASRRLMNLMGTKVMVPTSSLERAREILQPTAVDPVELEREALAADPGHTPHTTTTTRAMPPQPTDAAAKGSSITGLLLLLTTGAAVLFAFLWQKAAKVAFQPHPELVTAWDGDILRESRRSDGRLLRLLHDRDQNGAFERIEQFNDAGQKVVEFGDDRAGIYARVVETRGDDLTVTWTDNNRDGIFDIGVVTDGEGKVVQRILWQPGTGFVLQGP
jgi:hypothetical protein